MIESVFFDVPRWIYRLVTLHIKWPILLLKYLSIWSSRSSNFFFPTAMFITKLSFCSSSSGRSFRTTIPSNWASRPGRWQTHMHVQSVRLCSNLELFLHNTIQYNTIQYNTIQYNTTQYNTIQYNTIQYNTIQYKSKHLANLYIYIYIYINLRSNQRGLVAWVADKTYKSFYKNVPNPHCARSNEDHTNLLLKST